MRLSSAPTTALLHDAERQASAPPDMTILAYPVISMDEDCGHLDSRPHLIGLHPSPALVHELSNETQVTAATPPAFIYVTDADTLVPPENSIAYYLALHRQHVPTELHVFRTGKHGSGLGQHEPLLSIWPELLARWMAGLGYLAEQPPLDRKLPGDHAG